MNSLTNVYDGLWAHHDNRQIEYRHLDLWTDLARLLERGQFDALFLADVIGVYDKNLGSRDVPVRDGAQIPINDPLILIPAMAHVTNDLGFVVTYSILQAPPFSFARQVSTLDHITEGRFAWNIVTSFLESAWRNLGFVEIPPHDERYERAEEYMEVVYKLWEASWEDDAVVRDRVRRIYTDPAKVHDINHVGKYFDVKGPHLSEPSPQRTPVLFQAGASGRGREFAAKHAECIFIAEGNPIQAAAQIEDTALRAAKYGRKRDDIRFFQAVTFVIGGTEAEAKQKDAEFSELISTEALAARVAGYLGVDFGHIDPDKPLREILADTTGALGPVERLIRSAPDSSWTWRHLLHHVAQERVVGAPEQVVEHLEQWADAGVDGFNIQYVTTPGSFADFVDGVVPLLQDRGLMQREYTPGTFREKLFESRHLNASHPGASYRASTSSRSGGEV